MIHPAKSREKSPCVQDDTPTLHLKHIANHQPKTEEHDMFRGQACKQTGLYIVEYFSKCFHNMTQFYNYSYVQKSTSILAHAQ